MADFKNVTTGLVRFSYLHCWEPSKAPGSEKAKYSVALLIPKSDKATVAKITEAINTAKEDGKAKWGGKIPAKLKTPLRDGDEEHPDDPNYKGMWFLNANSDKQPGIVDKKRNPILEKDEMYSGCYGLAAINFYAFDVSGNKGVACGLQHLMKIKDGEALAGGVSVDEAFEAVNADDYDDFM